MQFTKKTSSSVKILRLIIKFTLVMFIIFAAVFLLNRVDFPKPIKEIEKIISNENFKVIK